MNVAAIDLGSNSIKILVVKRNVNGELQVLFRHRSVVRLGQGTFKKNSDSRIPKAVQARTLKVFESYAKILEAYSVDVVRATGTSALRDAANGLEFIKEVRQKTGINLEVLSEFDEARYIAKGVLSEFPQGRKSSLLIDLGGGSCEISSIENGKISKITSLPLGAVRTTENFFSSKKTTISEIKKLENYVKKTLASAWQNFPIPKLVIGSAGTIRTIGRVINKTELDSDDNVIHAPQLGRLVNKVMKMNVREIDALPGVDSKRAEIFQSGIIVIQQIFKHFKVEKMMVSQKGLREGMILDLLSGDDHPQITKNEFEEQILDAVHQVALKYHSDQRHCYHVWKMANQLFDGLEAVHGLPANSKKFLMVACLLHDAGKFINRETSYHKHTQYILSNEKFSFLTPKEQLITAALSRYFRKSPPKMEHEPFAKLDSPGRKMVLFLACLLRMADGLDFTRDQCVKWVKCHWGPGKVRMMYDTKTNANINIPVVREKFRLFEETFKMTVNLVHAQADRGKIDRPTQAVRR